MRTVMCFGDSNTHGSMAAGTGHPRFARDTRWPGVLAATLGPDWHVVEEGHPGRTTTRDDPFEGAHKNGLTALPALLESHRPLDLVVIMLGTNDLKNRFGASPDDIARGAERLAGVVLASDAGPGARHPSVLLVVPPGIALVGELGDMFAGAPEKAPGLAAAFRRAGARLGVPVFEAAPHAEIDMDDGVHLTAAGQRALGRAVAAEIARLWP
jgi:lysophospholipase L1-like esterase